MREYRQLAAKIKRLADISYDDPMGALDGLRKLHGEIVGLDRGRVAKENLDAIKKHDPKKHNITFTNPGERA